MPTTTASATTVSAQVRLVPSENAAPGLRTSANETIPSTSGTRSPSPSHATMPTLVATSRATTTAVITTSVVSRLGGRSSGTSGALSGSVGAVLTGPLSLP